MTANPTLLSMPLAQNGQKNEIPTTQATAGDGLFSQSTGFPAETSLPLGAGGVAPSREDFNGMANLLGGVAFMAQKGFTFNYDATQDYYEGCVVMDGGNRYLCIADMTAGTVAPSADTTHDYWIFYPVGVINKRDIVTTSGTYTAPVTGWYKITVKGGGGGGQGGSIFASNVVISGAGGGEGGTSVAFEYLAVGDTATVVIGAGGAGGSLSGTGQYGGSGANGGNTTATVNGHTYTGGGGQGGSYNSNSISSSGGTGDVVGASGGRPCAWNLYTSGFACGCSGGGIGGGANGGEGTQGGGGGGGYAQNSGSYVSDGGNGGNGFAWFEYFDGSLNP